MGGSRWMNFEKQLRKVGFDDYKKDKSKNAYPRLRTFSCKIQCVLSFQAIYSNRNRLMVLAIFFSFLDGYDKKNIKERCFCKAIFFKVYVFIKTRKTLPLQQ